MIRIYSLLVLLYDIVYLAVFTGYSILHAFYRLLCPRSVKSLQDEVAVVSRVPDIDVRSLSSNRILIRKYTLLCTRLSERVAA